MNNADYIEKVNRLRAQIEKDSATSPFAYPSQLAKANKLIAEIAAYDESLPEIRAVISTLKQTLKAFYSENQNRGWAQQFALNDIRKLADLRTQSLSMEKSNQV